MFVLGFHLFGTFGKGELPESIVKRLGCHVLLQRLPDEALSEAVESLSAMHEFYHYPCTSPLPLPAPKTTPARITGSYVEPVYPVSEE